MNDCEENRPLFAETLATALILLLAFGVVLAAALQPWIDPRWLFMDPQTVGELRQAECCHAYDGAISNLGLILWAAAATAALFAVMARLKLKQNFGFAAYSCFVSGMLLLDDTFLFHEVVLPELGAPQTVAMAILGGIALVYLLAWRRLLMESKYSLLLHIGLTFFVVSIGIDQVFSSISSTMIVLEDGSKFMGIVCWFLFHLKFFRDDVLINSMGAKS